MRRSLSKAIAPALVAFGLVLGPAVSPAGSAAPPTTGTGTGTGEQRLPVTVVVDSIVPLAPTSDDNLTIRGRLVNDSGQPLTKVRARLRVGDSPLSRTQIAEYASGRRTSPSGGLAPGEAAGPIVAEQLPAHGHASYRLSVPVNRLPLSRPGSYVLSVEVVATFPNGERQRTGLEQTFLPWLPDRVQPTQVVLLWPVVDLPRRNADGVFLNDGLATELRPDRPLGGLLAAGAGRQVTWAVDPELLETVADMADGYQVRAGDHTDPGTGQELAGAWLEDVRTATTVGEVVALGYADPDATALQHHNLSNDLIAATSLGRRVADRVLGRTGTGDVAWPVGGLADPATLETLRTAGTSTVIVSSRQFPADAPFTPSGRATIRTLGGTLDGLVFDAGLSDALSSRRINSAGAGTLAVQRFLAETATITAQRPDDPRTVLVAPPRRWRPSPPVATRLLTSIEHVPWVSVTPLSELRDMRPPDVERQQGGYPRTAVRAELPARYLREVSRLRADLLNFGAILTEPTPTTDAYDAAILRTESSGWRDSRKSGAELRRAVRSGFDDLRSKVHVIVSPNATLASSSGVLPITVSNGLGQPVRLGLSVTSENRARLTVSAPSRIDVPAETNRQVTVPLKAIANGVTTVRVQLTTPEGGRYGRAVPVRVNATSIGTIGMFVTGGALAVLFLAASIRVVRRLRLAAASRRRLG
jgi:hypothetical protein